MIRNDLAHGLAAVDGDRNRLPPRAPRTLSRAEAKRDAVRRDSALDGLPETRSADRHSIVEVEFATAIIAWIDVDLERSLWRLHGAFDQRLARQDRACANENGNVVELRLKRNLVLGHWEARPIIVPRAGG